MQAVVVLVASLVAVISGQEVDLDLSRGPVDADSSIQLDSRGGIATFQGAFPKEGLLAVHERLTESYENEAEEARNIFDQTQEPVAQLSPYQWAYEVHAASTGDQKSQVERREEDGVVRGSYSLVEPDGSRRTVTYVAHPEEGFQATVETEPSRQDLQNPISDASQNSFQVAPTQQQGYSAGQYHSGNRNVGHRQQQFGDQRQFLNVFQQQQFNNQQQRQQLQGFGNQGLHQQLINNAQHQQHYGRLHLQPSRQPQGFINQGQYANQGQQQFNNQNQYALQQQQLRQQQQFLNQQRLQQQQQYNRQQQYNNQQLQLRLQQQQQYERRRSQIIKLQPKVGVLPPIFGHQRQHGGQQQQHFTQQRQQFFTQQNPNVQQPFIGQQPRFRSSQAVSSNSAQSGQFSQGQNVGPVEYAVVPVTLHRINQ